MTDFSQPLEELKRLAMAQCTQDEILLSLRATREELESVCQTYFKASFETIYESSKMEGQIQIRLAQYNAAVSGDKEMLKLLGKEVLRQGQDDSEKQNADKVIVMLPALKPIGDKTGNKE